MAPAAAHRRTLVLGLGNPLGGDDAFGPLVLERLNRPGSPSVPDADLINAHTDLLGYLDRFADYGLVVLVDAILDPEKKIAPSGEVVALAEECWTDYPASSPSAHQVSPILAVRLFRELHPRSRTRFLLVGLCTEGIHIGRNAPGNLTEENLIAAAEKVLRAVSEYSGNSLT